MKGGQRLPNVKTSPTFAGRRGRAQMLDVLRFEIIPCASQVHLPSMMHNNWKFLHYSRNM